MNLRNPRFSLAVCLTAFAFHPCLPRAAGEDVVSAEKIRETVVHAEVYRSLRSPVRKGYRPEVTRSAAPDRSLSMVEVEVQVDESANISLPIRFELDSATELADAVSQRQLAELAEALKGAPAGTAFLVEGHTCVLGETDHNNRLSVDRAGHVVRELVKAGVKAEALQAIGCGAAEAVKDGRTKENPEPTLAGYRKVIIHRIAR